MAITAPAMPDGHSPCALILRLDHGAGQHSGDPDVPGQLRRVLVGGSRRHAEHREDHVHEWHHEQENPEG
jgi:hypothetical protein